MTRFVAFLRGINVGGHNIINKHQLLEVFASLGYQAVTVYRQSGNVIFTTDKSAAEAAGEVQQQLQRAVKRDVGVFVRTLSYLKQLVEGEPFKGLNSENSSFMVTFFSAEPKDLPAAPLKIPKSTAEVICIGKSEAYSVTHGGGEGALPNPFLEKMLKVQATTRNINTLVEIVKTYSE